MSSLSGVAYQPVQWGGGAHVPRDWEARRLDEAGSNQTAKRSNGCLQATRQLP